MRLPLGKNLTFLRVLAIRRVECLFSGGGRLAMSISLPKPIAEYFAAEKAGDAARLASCFVSDGVVHDEGGTFTGAVAIERWNAAARAKYHHTLAPIGSTWRARAATA